MTIIRKDFIEDAIESLRRSGGSDWVENHMDKTPKQINKHLGGYLKPEEATNIYNRLGKYLPVLAKDVRTEAGHPEYPVDKAYVKMKLKEAKEFGEGPYESGLKPEHTKLLSEHEQKYWKLK